MISTEHLDTLSSGSFPAAAAGVGPSDGSKPGLSLALSERLALGRSLRSLRLAFWSATLLLGALDAWCRQFSMSPIGPFADGISYIDIAGAYARGDWTHALNAYWSPLYSWALAPVLGVLRPSAAAEFPVVHLVNFLIYGAALGSFDFFWRLWLEDHLARTAEPNRTDWLSLPPWALLALGYSLFTWTSISWIGVQLISPDLLVSALVYLAAGLLLQFRRRGRRPQDAARLGAVLGFGFLAKAVMLPVSLVFMLVACLPGANPRRATLCLLCAGGAFLIVAAPFVAALSHQEGRLTFGDTGRLNYAWYVNGVPQVDWQGEVPGHGTPKHPTRLLYPAPPVYGFAGPIGGTYPYWTDPAYWNEGVRARFNAHQQVRVLAKNLQKSRPYLWTNQSGMAAGVFILLVTGLLVAKRRWSAPVRWDLLLIAMTPTLLYMLVIPQSRYLGSFDVLFWLGLLSAVRLPANDTSKAMAVAATLVMLLTPAVGLARRIARDLVRRSAGHEDWDAATQLRAMGVQAGDRVGTIGLSFDVGWAHLARVSLVAHISSRHEAEYWNASPAARAAVLRAFAQAGVKVVVTGQPPAMGLASGWHRLDATNRYARLLPPVAPS